MKYLIVTFTLLLCMGLSAQTQGLSNKLQVELDKIQNRHTAPGVTFSVVLPNGEVIALASGKADLERNIAMTPTHKMLGGSTGKVFYSVVIMQLVEEGILDLDKPIQSYLGHLDWFERLPNAEGLTLRNLMRHETGMPRYVFKESFQKDVLIDADKDWKPAELLAYVLDDEPLFEVESSFAYSDTNYIIACLAVEEVTGTSLYDHVMERVVKKAGLKQVEPQNKRKYTGMAQGYNGSDPFFSGNALENGKSRYNWKFEWAGGGLLITSKDLAVLAKKIYEGEMFSKDLLDEYFNGRDAGQMGGTWGLGVHIRDGEKGKIYGHSGFMPGYVTNMMYFEDKGFSICYQVNGSAPEHRGILRDLPSLAKIVRESL